jgi:hypothetical protein
VRPQARTSGSCAMRVGVVLCGCIGQFIVDSGLCQAVGWDLRFGQFLSLVPLRIAGALPAEDAEPLGGRLIAPHIQISSRCCGDARPANCFNSFSGQSRKPLKRLRSIVGVFITPLKVGC